MITIFGIGTAGSNIASLFREHKNYNIINFTTQEQYEGEMLTQLECDSLKKAIPLKSVKTTFPDLSEHRLRFPTIYRSSSVGLPFPLTML